MIDQEKWPELNPMEKKISKKWKEYGKSINQYRMFYHTCSWSLRKWGVNGARHIWSDKRWDNFPKLLDNTRPPTKSSEKPQKRKAKKTPPKDFRAKLLETRQRQSHKQLGTKDKRQMTSRGKRGDFLETSNQKNWSQEDKRLATSK